MRRAARDYAVPRPLWLPCDTLLAPHQRGNLFSGQGCARPPAARAKELGRDQASSGAGQRFVAARRRPHGRAARGEPVALDTASATEEAKSDTCAVSREETTAAGEAGAICQDNAGST